MYRGIRSAGYNTVTPVIITNSDEYESVEQVAIGDVEKLAPVIECAVNEDYFMKVLWIWQITITD